MRIVARLIIPVIALAFPLTASAATIVELQAQVSALIQQVQALQQYYASQQAASTGGTSSVACPQLQRRLSIGSTGTDVTQLQQFLAADPSVYPGRGLVTGYFGSLTEVAVQHFQVKNNIVSSGTPSTTGYGNVGPRTIAAIGLACARGAPLGAGGTSPGDLGAVMKVSPISGAAPLHSTFQVTVNTTNSCIAAIYLLDFGDGTSQPIPSVSGVCQPQSISVTHVYQYGGSYHVTLSSGTHQTHTSISVTGYTAPQPVGTEIRPKASVQIADYTFTPATLMVDPGTVVTWTNAGVVPHTVTADNGVFSSGDIQPGQIFAAEFDQPGTYPYYCKFHGAPGSGQIGSITVNAQSISCPSGYSLVGGQCITTTTSGTFSASPTSGTAPLAVTFSNMAGGGPLPGPLTIDFGDGSSKPAAGCTGTDPRIADKCTQQGVNTHIYTSAGTYTATLSKQGSSCETCMDIRTTVIGTLTITVGGASTSCPQYQQPLCPSGQHAASGSYNSATGCYAAPYCIAN